MPPLRFCFVFLAVLIGVAGCTNVRQPFNNAQGAAFYGRADPDAVAGDYLQGRFAASQQDYGRAADAFGRAADMRGDLSLVASAFRYALATGDLSEAKQYAALLVASPTIQESGHTAAMAGFLDEDLPRLTLVAAAFREGDVLTAQRLLASPLSSPLGQSVGHLLLGWSVYDADAPTAGVKALRDVPEGTFAGFVPFHMALMFDQAKDFGAAEVAYAEALHAPGADTAIIGYAGFNERQKTREEALILYRKMSADRGFLRRVGRMGQARLDDAHPLETREFLRLAEKAPLELAQNQREAVALAFLNYAWSAYEQAMSQQEAATRAGFERLVVSLEIPLALAQLAVSVDEKLGAGYYIIGAIAGAEERHAAAAAANKRVLPTSWLYNYAAIDRADAYVKMDQPDEAISLIREYLRQDALAPDVAVTLANLLSEQKDFDGATAAATQAVDIANALSTADTRGNNLWRYHFARGAIASEAGRWAEAEVDLRFALTLAPNEPLLLNFLGYSYVERGQNVDEAFGMIERALEARPSSGAITDSLGWAHYQRGDYEKAARLLERAVALSPGDDVITDHLGDAYWQLGRKIEARFEWRRVLEIDDLDPALRQRVEEKLAGSPPEKGFLATPQAAEVP